MKKILLVLALTGITLFTMAQNNPAGLLPLGIDTQGVPYRGSKGSHSYNNRIQDEVRVHSYKNQDVTRLLEKAVKETPDDLERIGKLLNAGGSAFITYEMIDKKQYKLMDLMNKNNSKLIRFSQLLHYACSKGDTTAVDFLIEHGASLDLCGCYLEKFRDNGRWLCRKQCFWNQDSKYYYTPQDVALLNGKFGLYNYILKKYNKRATIAGWNERLYGNVTSDKDDNNKIDWNLKYLKGEIALLENGIFVGDGSKDATKEVLNAGRFSYGHHGTNSYYFDFNYILIEAIKKLGNYRKRGKEEKAKKFEEFIKLMIEKGADVNVAEQHPSVGYYGVGDESTIYNCPMLEAMKAPNMLDIIKLLKAHGAKMSVKYFQKGEQKEIPIQSLGILDQYKELLIVGDL